MGLTFIIQTDHLRERVLSLSGFSGSDLAPFASDTAFQIGVLDFLLAHEPDLLAFVNACDLAPEAPAAARHILSGTPPDSSGVQATGH